MITIATIRGNTATILTFKFYEVNVIYSFSPIENVLLCEIHEFYSLFYYARHCFYDQFSLIHSSILSLVQSQKK